MYFDIDANFLGSLPDSGYHVMLKYTYLDSGASNSKFKIYYDSKNSGANTFLKTVTLGTTANAWKTDSVEITDGYFGNRDTRSSDFGFLNLGSNFNIIFSLVEIEKRAPLTPFAKKKEASQMKEENVVVNPNPAGYSFRVALKTGEPLKGIKIYSSNGVLVLNKQVNAAYIQVNKTELHNLKGVFNIIVTYANNKQATGKVIVE